MALYLSIQLLRRRAAATALLATLLALNLVVNNPVSSSRYWFGTTAFALFAAVVAPFGSRRGVRVLSIGVIGAVLVIFPIADSFRRDAVVTPTLEFNQGMLTHGDYDAFQQTINGKLFADREGHTLGRQLLGPVLFWVPREVWAAKPQGSGEMIAEALSYDFTNVSSPAWVEGYLDFGFFGALTVLIVFGLIGRRCDDAWVQGRRDFWGLLAPIYAAYQFVLLRGSLLAVIGPLAVSAALLIAVVGRHSASRGRERGVTLETGPGSTWTASPYRLRAMD